MNELRFDAAKKGHKQYDGKQCSKCGATRRYVASDGCVHCLRENTYRHRNKVRELIKKAREKAVQ